MPACTIRQGNAPELIIHYIHLRVEYSATTIDGCTRIASRNKKKSMCKHTNCVPALSKRLRDKFENG